MMTCHFLALLWNIPLFIRRHARRFDCDLKEEKYEHLIVMSREAIPAGGIITSLGDS